MLLGFKPQFAELIKNGTKIHTIREGNRFKVGDKLHMYTGGRTKNCQKIDVEGWPLEVKWVHGIAIRPIFNDVFICSCKDDYWAQIQDASIEAFAKNDGFENSEQMFEWFRKAYPKYDEINCQLIGWTDFDPASYLGA